MIVLIAAENVHSEVPPGTSPFASTFVSRISGARVSTRIDWFRAASDKNTEASPGTMLMRAGPAGGAAVAAAVIDFTNADSGSATVMVLLSLGSSLIT